MANAHPKLLSSALMLVILSIHQNLANCQIGDAAIAGGLSVIGASTVGKVLDDLQTRVQSIGLIADNDANLDFGNAYITLQSGLQGVAYSLDDERSKLVNNLDDERKNALLDIYVLADDMMSNKLPENIATLDVDILTVLNHVRILGKNTPFIIQRISPTVIPFQDNGDYSIQVLGIGIGNQEGKQLPTRVVLMPSDGPQITINPTNIPDGITFTIPRPAVEQRFSTQSFYRMNVNISSIAPTPCGPLALLSCPRPYEFKYAMVLFPKVAVSGVIAQIRTIPSTDPNTRQIKYATAVTPDGSGNHMQTWATNTVSADPGFKITSVNYDNGQSLSGNGCNFVLVDNNTMVPQNSGGSALITGRNNGGPCKLTFDVSEDRSSPYRTRCRACQSRSQQVKRRQSVLQRMRLVFSLT